MNTTHLRNGKKGITPVIATIILIAVTLVLGLVVGAYAFGLFGSNTKTITATSVQLTGGTSSSLAVSLNNAGSATTVASITVSNSTVSQTITLSTANDVVSPGVNSLSYAGSIFSGYVSGSSTISSGGTYNYVIDFNNGQAVTGSIIAQ